MLVAVQHWRRAKAGVSSRYGHIRERVELSGFGVALNLSIEAGCLQFLEPNTKALELPRTEPLNRAFDIVKSAHFWRHSGRVAVRRPVFGGIRFGHCIGRLPARQRQMFRRAHKLFALPLVRLLAINLAIGVSAAFIMLGGLLALDAGGLRHLIAADRSPATALALLGFGLIITFGSVAMGSAIMALGRGEPPPGGRAEDGDSDRGPAPVALRARSGVR